MIPVAAVLGIENIDDLEQREKLHHISLRSYHILHKLARLTATGLPDDEIALILGYKFKTYLGVLRKSKEYATIYAGLIYKENTHFDEEYLKTEKGIQERVRQSVPKALQVLADKLNSNKEDIQIHAAREIIGLDKRFRKDSPSATGTTNIFNISDSDISIADQVAIAAKTSETKDKILPPKTPPAPPAAPRKVVQACTRILNKKK